MIVRSFGHGRTEIWTALPWRGSSSSCRPDGAAQAVQGGRVNANGNAGRVKPAGVVADNIGERAGWNAAPSRVMEWAPVTSGERALRVVVAEDDEDQREALVMRLEREGHRVVALEDGYEMLDYVRLASGKGILTIAKPDFIIADVRMPGQTGLDVLDEARREGLACPILVLTGYNTPEVRMRVKALGTPSCSSSPSRRTGIVEMVATARSGSSAA